MAFSDILSRQMSDVKPPPQLPRGSYVTTVAGVKTGEITNKEGIKRDIVDFDLKIISPMDDVDRDEIAAIENGVTGRSCPRLRFFCTEEALFRLTDFLQKKLGLENMSISEALAQARGHQVVVKIKHSPRQDGSGVYSEIEDTAAV